MEVDASQNQRDDQISDRRSIGSNYHPSSQSRKISIGVMADSVAKRRSGAAKEDVVAIPSAERMNLNVETSIKVKKKGKEVTAPEQESSPWITTRSLYQQAPSPETVLRADQPDTSGTHNKLNGQNNAQATYSVQFFTNKTSVLQSGDGKQKKFDGVTCKRKGVKKGTTGRVEEFSFASAQEIHVSDKVVTEDKSDKTENRTETLRMKLWEILGNVSSPNQHSNSQRHEVGTNNLKLGQSSDQKGATVVRPRQNSDTIEADSEGSDHTIKRPVTRSLTRKRAPSKVQAKVTKCGPPSSYIQKHQEKNIFSLEEGWCGRENVSVNGGSSKPMRKKSEKKSTRIKPPKIFPPIKDIADKIQQASYRSETMLPAERTSSLSNKMGDIHDEREYTGLEKKILEQNSHLSPGSPLRDRTDQQMDFKSPAKADLQDIANQSFTNVIDPQGTFQSPTFGFKTPVSSSTPASTPKTDQLEHDAPTSTPKRDQMVHGVLNPAPAERIFTVGDICSFRNLWTSKPDRYESNTQVDAEELKFSPPQEAAADTEEKDTENSLSESSAEERDCESLEEGSSINEAYSDCRERDTLSPEPEVAEKPKFMLHSTKRLRTCEGIRFDNISPTLPSPKETGESNWIQEPSEQSQDDAMSRAIKLFALELQKLQSKIKSETTKKSSEILMSIADGMYLQLQNLEAHIQTDVGKMTSLSKLKRKRLEAKFEEQQQQLNLIHEKFKEDINQYLQDCRSTLEGMEAHHIELKGTVEKQKASHRKRLLQAEEAVETQLNDAKRRITAIHELARRKMLQLKHVISLCLKEGIVS
ncbi:meiosis-specific protein ASY3 isoform X2 [Corylus avellana]|uniref:meiosis-specific protein ASY3 isoform X2 n=1 Tax=Corylus avellana TaxID=13451 RepID=UPI00286CB316|nr:meiosis-specific protein ASY3 isoform X2 [Corylus avellana]